MKLLLHICCAPCSIMCIETLRGEGIEPVGFWDNPNIHPFTEFRMRRNTLVDYAKEIGLSLVVEGGYGLRPFLEAVGGDFDGRCPVCYRLRMRSAARYAAENGFTHFTTTLLISPYQNHELLAQTAREAAEEFGVAFRYRDFRPFFREGKTSRGYHITIYRYNRDNCCAVSPGSAARARQKALHFGGGVPPVIVVALH